MNITLDEAKAALVRSGYLIEARIEKKLLSARYYVDSNDAYPDPVTGKSRELDLFAITGRRLGRNSDCVFNVLLIECVNNPEPLVLITKRVTLGFLFHEVLRVAGLPVRLLAGDGHWISIQEALDLGTFHHYSTSRIATQFCSFTKKQSREWMALHEGPHFDSFQKLCDVVDYRQDQHFKSWKFGRQEPINIEFYYPVLVVQGDLLEARLQGTSVVMKAATHLQFRRTVIRQSQPHEYQIDVVTERHFGRFLSSLNRELDTIVSRIKTRRPIFQRSISKIARAARRCRSPDALRNAMEVRLIKDQ
jgi:hypothetical protein